MKYQIASDNENSKEIDILNIALIGADSGTKPSVRVCSKGRAETENALLSLIVSRDVYGFEETTAPVWEELNRETGGLFIDFFLQFGTKYRISGYPRGDLYCLSPEAMDFFLASFLHVSPDDPLFILSGDHFLYTNPSFLLFTGCQVKPGEKLFREKIFPHLEREKKKRTHKKLNGFRVSVRRYYAQVNPYHLLFYEGNLFSAGAIPEGNRIRFYEERCKKNNRLETIGLLSSTIAHDLNNTLGVIRGYCEILEKKRGESVKGTREVSAIRSAAERGIRLTSKILESAKKEEGRKEAVSLHSKAQTSMDMIARLYPGKLILEASFEAKNDLIQADPVEIDQVFMNLFINARDALGGRGHVRLHTENVTGESGEAIHVTLSDDGPGIPEEIAPRIFDPFFTTKEGDKGSGLGLYIVKLIITRIGGSVWAGTASGRGASIHFALPVLKGPLKS